jgi:hypothetical protein
VFYLACDFEYHVNLLWKGERRGPKTWPEGTIRDKMSIDSPMLRSVYSGVKEPLRITPSKYKDSR